MEKLWNTVREAIKNIDPVLFICATLLSLISIVTVYGAVDNFGMSKLKMQVAIFIVGIFVTVIIAFIDYRVIVDKLWVPMLVGSVLLLVITLLFGESGVNMETGNKSWLKIPGTGFMVQPSEFVKFTFVCTFAKHLFRVQDHINKPLTVLLLGGHALLVVGPILFSGDLGVALVYLALIALMLFCAGLHVGYFAVAAVVLVLAAPYLFEHLAPYQQRRILVGFNPSLDPGGYGWQPLLSRAAIAAGGFFGQGLFGGEYYEQLPASHTDFILSTVCEKFGFLGGTVVIIIFMIMVVRIFTLARSASHSDYGGLICAGIGSMFVVQILENIGMCFAMLPTVGITLPLLSCGGSSMLATFMMMGLLHNVYAHSKGVRDASRVSELDIDISLLGRR